MTDLEFKKTIEQTLFIMTGALAELYEESDWLNPACIGELDKNLGKIKKHIKELES